jgi:hypothetical protein
MIPWTLDLDRVEEDCFLRLMAPPAGQARTLSLDGARVLAAELRDAVGRRYALAAARAELSGRHGLAVDALGDDGGLAARDPWPLATGHRRLFCGQLLGGGLDPLASPGNGPSSVAGTAVRYSTDLRPSVMDALGSAEADGWEDKPRGTASSAAPMLAVNGFAGSLDWLLDLARTERIDLRKFRSWRWSTRLRQRWSGRWPRRRGWT